MKGYVKEVEEGVLWRKRVNKKSCCWGRKVADLKKGSTVQKQLFYIEIEQC